MLVWAFNSTAGSMKFLWLKKWQYISGIASLGFQIGRFLQDEACLYVRIQPSVMGVLCDVCMSRL